MWLTTISCRFLVKLSTEVVGQFTVPSLSYWWRGEIESACHLLQVSVRPPQHMDCTSAHVVVKERVQGIVEPRHEERGNSCQLHW